MKADTVHLLTTKGRFPLEQALSVAEAMDVAMREPQFVTVAMLDARFLAFEARFTAFEDKIEQRLQAFESKMESRQAAFEAKMEARFVAFEARMERKFDQFRLQMILVVVLSHGAMGWPGAALVNALKHLL